MKIAAICAFLLLLNVSFAGAFVVPAPGGRRIDMIGDVALKSSQQQQHDLEEKWEDFKAKEKQLEEAEDEEGALKLAIEMVETAMEYVHLEEQVDEEHVSLTHKALERVLKTEQALEHWAQVAHHDVDDAVLNTIYGRSTTSSSPLNNKDNIEKRRELLAVSDLAHHVETYAEERLHQAQDEEKHLHEEEDKIQEELRQLQWNELVLEETLEKLRAVQKAKERN